MSSDGERVTSVCAEAERLVVDEERKRTKERQRNALIASPTPGMCGGS